MLWLHTLLLAASTSLGRFILSDTKPWNQAVGTQGGTRTHDIEGWGTLLLWPSELLASITTITKHSWLVVSGSSELQKTSTITNNINNANYIFYLLWTLFEVHSPYIICPIPWMSGKSHFSLRKKRKLTIITWLFGTYSIFLMGCTIGCCLWFYLCHTLRAVLHHPVFQLALLEVESVDVRLVAR